MRPTRSVAAGGVTPPASATTAPSGPGVSTASGQLGAGPRRATAACPAPSSAPTPIGGASPPVTTTPSPSATTARYPGPGAATTNSSSATGPPSTRSRPGSDRQRHRLARTVSTRERARATRSPTRDDGTLWAWGRGTEGQVGPGHVRRPSTPRPGSADATDWGTNGRRRRPTTTSPSTPTGLAGRGAWNSTAARSVFGGVDIKAPSVTIRSPTTRTPTGGRSPPVAKDHTLGIRTDGSLWGWGDNASGQLGDGSREARRVPPAGIGRDRNWHMGRRPRRAPHARAHPNRWDPLGLGREPVNGQLGDGTTTGRSQRRPASAPRPTGGPGRHGRGRITSVRACPGGRRHSLWTWGINAARSGPTFRVTAP